ncbi:MAG: hypothetical protein IPG95_00005 [Saprospiraceae bacterium]|nr:hypothetical protein [Saprospiraceae bacterium]
MKKIKKENWNPDQMLLDIDLFLEKEKTTDYIYKRNSGTNKPGDFKQAAYDKEKAKLDKTKLPFLYTQSIRKHSINWNAMSLRT